jgi:hypothetical protein
MHNFCVTRNNERVIATCVEQSPYFEANGSSGSEKSFGLYGIRRFVNLGHPTSCPYPEPDESSHCPRILFI